MRKAEEILADELEACQERMAARIIRDNGGTKIPSPYAARAIDRAVREAIEKAIEVVGTAMHREHAEDELRKLLPHREGQ